MERRDRTFIIDAVEYILPEGILHQFKRIACGEAVEIPGVTYILDIVGKAHDKG